MIAAVLATRCRFSLRLRRLGILGPDQAAMHDELTRVIKTHDRPGIRHRFRRIDQQGFIEGVQGLPHRVASGVKAIERASCRERVCQYVSISVVPGTLKKKKK